MTRTGASAAEAFCPHLGSDLGPAAGGACARGGCMSFPWLWIQPARASPLPMLPHQLTGLTYSRRGKSSPDLRLVGYTRTSQWSRLRINRTKPAGATEIRTVLRPQETSENAVAWLTRYVLRQRGPYRTCWGWPRPYLNSRFDFKTTRSIAKVATLTLDLSANTHVHGLGYSFVELHVDRHGHASVDTGDTCRRHTH